MLRCFCRHVYRFLVVTLFLVLIIKVFTSFRYNERKLIFRPPVYHVNESRLAKALAKRKNTSYIIHHYIETVKMNLTRCPDVSPFLVGRSHISQIAKSWKELEDQSYASLLQPGGRYRPQDCRAAHQVAIIVPLYRDGRDDHHLRLFLQHMHPFLQRQQIDYTFFVIEQFGNEPFNRGKLMNIGAIEALLFDPSFQCFIFHDVNLLPEVDWNEYTCPGYPRHMAVSIDALNYKAAPDEAFGGVTAMMKEHFDLVNGFSNLFWGFDGEDGDMYDRIDFYGLAPIYRPLEWLARYTLLKKGELNKSQSKLSDHRVMEHGGLRSQTDGLTSLNYTRLDINLQALYVHVTVDIGKPEPS